MNRNYKYPAFSLQTLFLCLFLLFSGIAPGFAQADIENIPLAFQRSLYGFSFAKAISILNDFEKSNAGAERVNELKSQLSWWMILSGNNIQLNIDKCNKYLAESINDYKKIKNPDIDIQIKLINAYLLKLRIENYLDNKINSLSILHKLLKRVDDLDNIKEKDLSIKLISGLYYYFLEYIKSEYVLSHVILAGYTKGNKELGLRYLEECSNSNDDIIMTEAIYFLYKIYFSIEKNYPEAEKQITILLNLYPENLVFALEYYKVLLAQNQLIKAKEFKKITIDKIYGSTLLYEQQKSHFLKLLEGYKPD